MNRLITRHAFLLVFRQLLAPSPVCVEKSCAPPPPPPTRRLKPLQIPALPDENTAQRRVFEDRLLEIAASYETLWPRESHCQLGTGRLGWAPIPPTPEVAFSQSYADGGTHGGKLYSLFFAKDQSPAGAYVRKGQPCPTGQVIVKESWVPEEVKDDGKPLEPVRRKVKVRQGDGLVEKDDSFLPFARKDGRLYHAKEKGPLFIMFKMDPQTPGTDEGWVYGTVTADGKQVTLRGPHGVVHEVPPGRPARPATPSGCPTRSDGCRHNYGPEVQRGATESNGHRDLTFPAHGYCCAPS